MERLGVHAFVWTGGSGAHELKAAMENPIASAIGSSSFRDSIPRSSTSAGSPAACRTSISRSPSPWPSSVRRHFQ